MQPTTPKPGTKLVEIRLAGLTRLEYSEVAEVPASMTGDELDELLNKRYDEVNGGAFSPDPDYWEKGQCYWTVVEARVEPDVRVTLGENEELVTTQETIVDPRTVAQRIDAALEPALQAFWAQVAADFPEVTTGDLGTELAQAFKIAAQGAIAGWVSNNAPSNMATGAGHEL